jgi:hypothetical protein
MGKAGKKENLYVLTWPFVSAVSNVVCRHLSNHRWRDDCGP